MKAFANMIEVKRYFPVPAEDRIITVLKQIVQKQPIKDINVGGKILFMFIWFLTFIVPIAVIMYYLYTNGYVK
jgi:hypothetical protein